MMTLLMKLMRTMTAYGAVEDTYKDSKDVVSENSF